MIGIRADANEKIGMGHVMRCMSIAKQLKAQGEEVLFILSEAYAKECIEKNGFACVCLDNHYNDVGVKTINKFDPIPIIAP